MSEYFPKKTGVYSIYAYFRNFSAEIARKVKGTIKLNILVFLILVFVARMFFLSNFNEKERFGNNYSHSASSYESFDPLERIAQGVFSRKVISPKSLENEFFSREKNGKFEKNIYADLVKDYPIEDMVAEISKKDRRVAFFLISIAKKESNWGKHSPKKNGKECYNYWGYRGRENATDSGYSCFDSPEHAVSVVGGRIEKLINQKIDTPEKMVVWKCGYDCSWDNPKAVKKWIADVGLYYQKLHSKFL